MTHGKTYNKSPRRINHKATKSKTYTGTTALERSVKQTTGGGGGGGVGGEGGGGAGGVKALLELANFTLDPDATLNTEIRKNSFRIKAPNSVNASKRKHKNQINHYNKQRRVLMAFSTVCQSKWKPTVATYLTNWELQSVANSDLFNLFMISSTPSRPWLRDIYFQINSGEISDPKVHEIKTTPNKPAHGETYNKTCTTREDSWS